MLTIATIVFAVMLLVLIVLRQRGILYTPQCTVLGLVGTAAIATSWYYLDEFNPTGSQGEGTEQASKPISSSTCIECHSSRHASWHRTYHRTMTQDVTPETVKGDFNNAVFSYGGITSTLYRKGDKYFINTADPEWANEKVRLGIPLNKAGPPPMIDISIDRLVGSHWFQQMFHRSSGGKYLRLPLAYHIVEKRWIHLDGAFLAPDSEGFFGQMVPWNESCVFCHNTRPNKNATFHRDQLPTYETEVAELGISCEVCHGPGEKHVRAHQKPDRWLDTHKPGDPDPSIVNPAQLSPRRASEVCAHCHGAGPIPKPGAWNPDTQPDPFVAGSDLSLTHQIYWSEEDMFKKLQAANTAMRPTARPEQMSGPASIDGRFWEDGTPLTTAVEFQGMALSKCYQNGNGQMSCFTCHSMHSGDVNHQVKEGMRTNEACYSCHESYRAKLVEHTHHSAGSSGSLCYNCHMPYQVYSLLDTHRSHRIEIPRVKHSLTTGKSNACNLCHLDKSLGWTNDRLQKWYNTKPETLTDDQRNVASSVLMLSQKDARSRAIVAGAFHWKPAQQASGGDWPGPILLRSLETERYAAVRFLTYRSLRSLYQLNANDYDYLGAAEQRAEQLQRIKTIIHKARKPDPKRYPYLPFTKAGLYADDVLDRLRKDRKDPDVFVNE